MECNWKRVNDCKELKFSLEMGMLFADPIQIPRGCLIVYDDEFEEYMSHFAYPLEYILKTISRARNNLL